MTSNDEFVPPDAAPAADLPQHARERLSEMRKRHFFTSDLSVNEFLLVKQAGFEPLGLVMGSSIYHVGYQLASWGKNFEMTTLSQALYHARELAMTRMEEEADALGADGIVAVRLMINRQAWGSHVLEFIAIGTAIRAREGHGSWRTPGGKPFTSDLSGQDFWTLLNAGYRPLGFVMGNCVYHIAHRGLVEWLGTTTKNIELPNYTQALYDARELAMERMQAEAQALGAEGIVGVDVTETNHTWGSHVLEFSAVGTAVLGLRADHNIPVPTLILPVTELPMARQFPPVNHEESLQHVRQGGLPLRAQQRLAHEAGPHRTLFTSDLSVNEFFLSKEAGCTPIAQVMGSSIFHIGRIDEFKPSAGELTVISAGHREARRLALGRLWQEARLVGADAVVGMRLSERWLTEGAHGEGGDDGDEIIEFTAVGTAVKAPWVQAPQGGTIVTDLSGQDLWALHRNGWVPCGMVFEFYRYHVNHALRPGSTEAAEVNDASNAVRAARADVSQRLAAQASAIGAQFVVGSDINFRLFEVKCGFEGCEINDIDVDVSWFATGIRRAEAAHPGQHVDMPPLILNMTPVRRRRRDAVEAEDESKELQREAAEEDERR